MHSRPWWTATSAKRVRLLLLTIVVTPGSLPARATPGVEALPPETSYERRLSVGESHVYRPLFPTTGRWAVRLDQLAVDVEIEARWPGADPARFDSPLDRDGTELLILPDAVRDVELKVTALATAGEPGRYRIRLDTVDDSRQVEALETLSEAGRAYAQGGGEGRRRALTHYRRAVDLWRELERPRFAAQSLYAAAVIHRLLGEGPAALELARDVLPLWQALGDAGREADTFNEIGLLESTAGRLTEAREAFRQALTVQQGAGDLFRQAATSNNLCLTHLMRGEHRQALDCYGPALERIRAAKDDEHEAVALTNLGTAHRILGHPEEALELFRRAAALHRQGDRDKREAETLNNLAALHNNLGERQEALELYLQALEIFRQQGDRRWEGRVLHNLGTVYNTLGDPERAQVFYHQALALRQELGDLRGEANTLKVLGRVELDGGQTQPALELFHRALELERTTEDRRGAAVALRLIGQTRAALGDHRDAVDLFDRALEPFRALDDRRNLAKTLLQQGRSLLTLERWSEATETLTAAAETSRSLGLDLGEGAALFHLAETDLAAGRPGLALTRVNESIQLFESLRTTVGDPDLRSTFAGRWRDAYGLRIDLLMTLYGASGETRHLHAALETSERARAQGLVDILQQTGTTHLQSLAPELESRLRTARRRLHVQAGKRRKLLANRAPQAEQETVEADFFHTLAELEKVEAEIRRQRPGHGALLQPAPLTTPEIQGLLEPGTALVEYALGERRSFLFLVTTETVRSFELPTRQALEDSARRAHEQLSSPQGDDTEVAEVARVLLTPAMEALTAERLVVVADGALHYLPFAALPLPATEDRPSPGPLLTRYEVVHLPSASVLAAERQRNEDRRPAPRWAAVLADPVFDRRDLRLAAVADSDESTASTTEVAGDSEWTREGRQPLDLELPRLRMSRQEAETIADLAPPDDVLVATGFDADRSLVLGGRLADYRIVHFATHGVIDARHPALSGLALSLFDLEGRPRNGFLRLRDIYGLRWQADLVVLSACRTALGKEVRGEGLLGLTRGFLHAGTRRIVASLWSVPDRATAELMARFYRAMAESELSPAAALRQAQLSMLDERRYHDPHNWAGFVLLGDWR